MKPFDKTTKILIVHSHRLDIHLRIDHRRTRPVILDKRIGCSTITPFFIGQFYCFKARIVKVNDIEQFGIDIFVAIYFRRRNIHLQSISCICHKSDITRWHFACEDSL